MKKFLCTLAFIAAITSAYSLYINNLAGNNLAQDQRLFEWAARLIRDIAIFIFVWLSIVISFWEYQQRNSSLHLLFIFITVSIGATFIAVSFYSQFQLSKLENHLSSRHINQLWSQQKYQSLIDSEEINPKEKYDRARMLASMYYTETGKKILVPDIQGNLIEYTPSASDVELYNNRLNALKTIKKQKASLFQAFWFWIFITLTAIAAGVSKRLRLRFMSTSSQ